MGHADEPPASESPAALELGLVARASGGDTGAFELLVARHADRVHALALRLVRNSSDAEEVAQDAFVRAWRALPRFRGEAAFATWLHRIVVRCAFDRLAILRGRREREADLDLALAAATTSTDPARLADHRQLERLVAELPDMQRAAVTLYYLEDRSVQDVAFALDLNVNTVKTHLSRARAALREAWLRRAEDA
jgi:RNA polymerase sigma-70 factor (ECF subfamily)